MQYAHCTPLKLGRGFPNVLLPELLRCESFFRHPGHLAVCSSARLTARLTVLV